VIHPEAVIRPEAVILPDLSTVVFSERMPGALVGQAFPPVDRRLWRMAGANRAADNRGSEP